MKSRKIAAAAAFLLTYATSSFAQDKAPENWFNLDFGTDKVRGVSTEKAYQELLKDKQPKKTIVVAVIDSGVEADHEDLKDVMWVNEDEKAGNGVDDDGNGYIDDVHGWNFIGGKNGENVSYDTYELTRLYGSLKAKSKLSGKEKKVFETVEKKYKSKFSELQMNFATYEMINSSIATIAKHLGKEDYTKEEVDKIETKDKDLSLAKQIMSEVLDKSSLKEMKEQMTEWGDYLNNGLKYGYNTEFNPRTIVGDNYEDAKERIYGNSDVEGPDAEHGTHVAGIIGASRDNGTGMKGVANNVRIMSIRTVPNGDERDKDVANAIRYAVDNGATVVNMSFGKAFSYNKKTVDEAVKYAEKKGVLLVHAAGNNSEDNDVVDHFPTRYYENKKEASNWIDVGALNWEQELNTPAPFSNYGKKTVDLFAPGVDIYSTIPDGKYKDNSGTSMAAPVVAGVAALVWSYYPELTMAELRKVLLESAVRLDIKVKRPGGEVTVGFADLSITGAVVNVYEALKAAEKVVAAKAK